MAANYEDLSEGARRIIELAEDRFAAGEKIGLSLAGELAEVISAVLDVDLGGAAEILKGMDKAINERREAHGDGQDP